MQKQKENKRLVLKNEPGFTLIEVLIAIVILSIGLLGMASLSVSIIKGNRLSNDLTTATTLAQQKMEDIRLAAEADFTAVGDETAAVVNDVYIRGVDVDDDNPAPGMKRVTTTVSWGGASKTDHKVELVTILSQ
jgi:type IV pilus assembly protein PilV